MALIIGTSYLFDTTVFIDAYRNRREARNLLSQADNLDLAVGYSILTEVELWAWPGMRNPQSAKEHKVLLRPFQRYFINVTIAQRAGELRRLLVEAVGKNNAPGIPDCMIAATAEYHDLTVCSHDTHFGLFTQFGIALYVYTNMNTHKS